MIEKVLTFIVIPIFVGVTINKLSNKDKKEKNHQSISRSNGGFTFTLSINFEKKK